MSSHIMSTYGRLPVSFVRGQGAWLWDKQGQRYLDALAGVAVCNLGHAHPDIHRAICAQSETLLHTSNWYGIELQEQLAEVLTTASGMDSVFFGNSGAEANEAAIKLARKYGHQKGIAQPAILVMEKSFHGRTLATLSASGNAKIQQGFEPLVSGFIRVPFNDVSAIEQAIQENPTLVAIMLEPVQGEGGVHIPARDYLTHIRALCDRHELLMILDEIQTGIGRTGKLFAFQHHAIVPDVCTLAKALGNGVPIGACLARGKAAEVLGAGSHGSTFGGNLLACSAALAVMHVMQRDNLSAAATAKGQAIADGLQQRLKHYAPLKEIRHLGLMVGIELHKPCTELLKLALAKYLLINVTSDTVIRLLPPLIIEEAQITLLVNTLADTIEAWA